MASGCLWWRMTLNVILYYHWWLMIIVIRCIYLTFLIRPTALTHPWTCSTVSNKQHGPLCLWLGGKYWANCSNWTSLWVCGPQITEVFWWQKYCLLQRSLKSKPSARAMPTQKGGGAAIQNVVAKAVNFIPVSMYQHVSLLFLWLFSMCHYRFHECNKTENP